MTTGGPGGSDGYEPDTSPKRQRGFFSVPRLRFGLVGGDAGRDTSPKRQRQRGLTFPSLALQACMRQRRTRYEPEAPARGRRGSSMIQCPTCKKLLESAVRGCPHNGAPLRAARAGGNVWGQTVGGG